MSNDNQANEVNAENNDWIIPINNMLATVTRPSKLSIYKVPNKLLKLEEDAYTPSIVSIGPFHHNNKVMQAFEEHKQLYMLHLFMRIFQAAESTLQECATAILKLEGEARRCYSEKIDLDKHKLAEILLVDGCFLLELFLRYSHVENHKKDKVEDPLINNAWTIATLQHDLAVLENQIPFSVLETLFNIIKDRVPQPLRPSFTEHNVATLALCFFKSALGLSDQAIQSKSLNLSGNHLLDILHNFYLPVSDKTHHDDDDPINGFENCTTQLLKTGIQFEGKTDTPKKKIP